MTFLFGGVEHEVPSGAVIGCLGSTGSGVAGLVQSARALEPHIVSMLYTLDSLDALERLHAESTIEKQRSEGTAVFLASHDLTLLKTLADEIWWVVDGRVHRKGHPDEVLQSYQSQVVRQYRLAGTGSRAEIAPSMRRGDGRAQIVSLEILDGAGKPTSVWQSGEPAAVRVVARFAAKIEDPVIGIMIRTRIGMEVYGTNTELEHVKVGPCSPGDTRAVLFSFDCALCPQAYSVTAASHDPDGVWHDWLEDAVAFTVTDSRYTAGVANLRARVSCSRE
jgi:hypothetical protein